MFLSDMDEFSVNVFSIHIVYRGDSMSTVVIKSNIFKHYTNKLDPTTKAPKCHKYQAPYSNIRRLIATPSSAKKVKLR
jgi:hypothetical protein